MQREDVLEVDAGDNFREHGAEGQERTHCRTESGVFALRVDKKISLWR